MSSVSCTSLFSLWVDTPPQWCPEPWALQEHYPSGRGLGSRGLSDWSRTPSCGAPRSRWLCRTRQWCWTCPQKKWACGPTRPEATLEPEQRHYEQRQYVTLACNLINNLYTTHKVIKGIGSVIYLASLLAVREIAVSGEPAGSEWFAWIWVLWSLKSESKVVKAVFCN